MKVRAVIDRFEEDRVVLLLGENEDRQVNWFRQDLPAETCEGDILVFSVEVDAVATAQAKAEAAELLKNLTNGASQS